MDADINDTHIVILRALDCGDVGRAMLRSHPHEEFVCEYGGETYEATVIYRYRYGSGRVVTVATVERVVNLLPEPTDG